MSGNRSPLGFVVRVDRLSMAADQPVSADTTILVRNNLQHLIDQSVQYRVSWALSTVEDGLATLGVPGFFVFPFCTSIVDETTIPSFDLHVSARLTDVDAGPGEVRARIVSAINIDNVIHRFDPLALSTTSVVSTTQNVDLELPWGRTEVIGPGGEGLDTGIVALAATGLYSTRVVPLLLIVDSEATDHDEGYVQVCSVQLREYLSQ